MRSVNHSAKNKKTNRYSTEKLVYKSKQLSKSRSLFFRLNKDTENV